MNLAIPPWSLIETRISFIKNIPDFYIFFKDAFGDYLTQLRQYRRISAEKRQNIIKNKAKEIFNRTNLIAITDREFPEIVYSFIAYEMHKGKLMIHFCYTKEDFRNASFIKKLLGIIEHNKNKFVFSAPTSKPRIYSIFKKYTQERML